jgi:plastocyanin
LFHSQRTDLRPSIPVAADETDFRLAELKVVDTKPVWIYCRQAGHCQQGMVFAVNPGDKLAAFQAAATGGAAPSTPPPSSTASSPSPSSTSTDHVIVVGGPAGLVYTPSNIQAQPGDTVTFQFHEKNHTVTASSFAQPCRALSLTSTTGQAGFDSGFMAVDAAATTFPTYTIQINDVRFICS